MLCAVDGIHLLWSHLTKFVVSEIKDAKKLKINERVGQAGERIFAQGQGLQIYETAYFVGESGQFVSVQVEFSEVGEITDAAWQMRNLKNQTKMFQFWTICKKKYNLHLTCLDPIFLSLLLCTWWTP